MVTRRSSAVLLFLWGLLLPICSLEVEPLETGTVISGWERLQAVDALSVLLVVWFSLSGQLRFRAFVDWCAPLGLCLIAFLSTLQHADMTSSQGLDATLSVGALFLIVFTGLVFSSVISVGGSQLHALVAGVLLGSIFELVIAVHDWAAAMGIGEAWFQDRMNSRVRGTFRTNGQLAQYGVGVGLFLVAIGTGKLQSIQRVLFVCQRVGLALLLTLPLAASRRSALVAVAPTLLVLSFRLRAARWFLALMAIAVITALTGLGTSEVPYLDFVSARLSSIALIGEEDSFMYEQFIEGREHFLDHPTLGTGWGRSKHLMSTGHEIHNQYLAVAAESGLVGLICVLAMFAFALYRCARCARARCEVTAKTFGTICLAAIVTTMILWTHNRGLRDRTFSLNYALWVAGSAALSSKVREPRPLGC